jgi:sulfatase modifying factor 1
MFRRAMALATVISPFATACSVPDYSGFDRVGETGSDSPLPDAGCGGNGCDGADVVVDGPAADSPLDGFCPGEAGPASVLVSGTFCADSTEVSNAQYAQFLAATDASSGQPTYCSWNTSYQPSSGWPATGRDGYPVAFVDWCDAYMFCQWAGKRLCGDLDGGPAALGNLGNPSFDQWDRACSQNGALLYPYGGVYDAGACNGLDHAAGMTVPAGSMASCAGGYPGLFDMSGNVLEWEDACNQSVGSFDHCTLRGGSFNSAAAALECAATTSPRRKDTSSDVGFRCCSP